MRRYDPRLILGVLLVLGGVLSLLDVTGIISSAGDIFGGILFGAGGLFLLSLLIHDRNNWWLALPAFTLLGLSAQSFLPESLEAYDGLVFFAGISLGFWWVYFGDTIDQWWAIIPGGVLFTLAVTSAVENLTGMDTDGLLFLGIGLTFMLVAVLPGGRSRSWALIPGTILVILGALFGMPFDFQGYLLPAALILLGGYFLWRFFMSRTLE
jgi:hypothetical protein